MGCFHDKSKDDLIPILKMGQTERIGHNMYRFSLFVDVETKYERRLRNTGAKGCKNTVGWVTISLERRPIMSSQTLTLTRGETYRRQHSGTANKFTSYILLTLVIIEMMAIFAPTIIAHAPTMGATSDHNTTTNATTSNVIVFTSVPMIEDVKNNDTIKEAVEAEMRSQEVLEAQIIEEIAEEERLAKVAEQQAYIDSIICDPTDVSRISGLKAEDFKYLTEGTWWSGHEETLYQLEQECGINALFAMSVSTLESGCGTSYRASSKHNYYGIELANKSWDSLYENTLWWGDMIQRVYIDGKDVSSVWNIGPIYCPPNRQWEVYMNDHMTELYNGLINNLQDTLQ